MSALIREWRDRRCGLPVRRMAHALAVGRATVYRRLWRGRADDAALRHEIQRIAVEQSSAGYRAITAELRDHGWHVNGKRVLRLMRSDNLLQVRKRKAWMTYRPHGLPTYPNLAAELQPGGIDQLWVADLTYVRLRWQWVFVAVIMDRFSRRCIGWALETHFGTALTLGALRMALARRRPAPGLVHHSDRGVQYAARDYVALLRAHDVAPSMSRAGNPYDNAACERFIRTLKYEEIYMRDYEDIADARRCIGRFLDHVYNHKRRHAALGYRTPAAFEESLSSTEKIATPA